jgi:hypothetical protein
LCCMVLQPFVHLKKLFLFHNFHYSKLLDTKSDLVYLPHYNVKSMRRNSLLWLKYCLSLSRSWSFQCGQSSSSVHVLWILYACHLEQRLRISCRVLC